jgi:putative peptidoglycan lipid II flippase
VNRKSEVTAPKERNQARAAFRVGAGIFFSRVAGFVRDAVFAFYFGSSSTADVWGAALKTPNLIQNLLGEGSLSASMIPVYAEYLEEGREEDAGRFAGATLGILAVTAWGLALVGILLAPVLARVFYFRWDPEQQALLVTLLRILFPMVATLVISAWALGILNSHRRFFISYVAPVFWNLAMISTLIALGSFAGWHAAGREIDLVVALGWGALVGSLLQLGVQLPWVILLLKRFRLSLGRKVAGVHEAIRNFLPVVTARGVVSLSNWIDTVLAAMLAPGAVIGIFYAQRLSLLPISLFGMSIAASELPELSRQRSEASQVLASRVSTALERVSFFMIPSVLAYLTFGDLLVGALFQRGRFSPDGTAVVFLILGAYSLGLLASAGSRVLSSAFYAVRDTRTPARWAIIRVVLSLSVGASLMFPLDGLGVGTLRLGAVGLAIGATVGAWIEYLFLRRGLKEVIGHHGPRSGRLPKMMVGGIAAVLAAALCKGVLGSTVPAREGILSGLAESIPWLHLPVLAVATSLAFGLVYLAVTSLLGVGIPPRFLRESSGS